MLCLQEGVQSLRTEDLSAGQWQSGLSPKGEVGVQPLWNPRGLFYGALQLSSSFWVPAPNAWGLTEWKKDELSFTHTSKQLYHEKKEITRQRLPPSLVSLNQTKTKPCLFNLSPINLNKVRKSHLGCGCSRAPNHSLREVMSRTCLSALL